MSRRTKSFLVAAIALILPAIALILPMRVAADAMKGHDEGRMRTYMMLRIADALGLSDEKALAVAHVFRDVGQKREDLKKKRHEIEDKIREGLKQSKPDSTTLAKLVDQAAELDKQQAQAADETFQALKKVLSVEEQAKLVLLRPELKREMHSMGGPMWGHGRGYERERGREHEHEGGREHSRWHGGGPDDDAGEG